MSRQVTTSSLETIGHIVGFAEERDNRPYDDGHVVPHRFTVFVPGIGPSLSWISRQIVVRQARFRPRQTDIRRRTSSQSVGDGSPNPRP